MSPALPSDVFTKVINVIRAWCERSLKNQERYVIVRLNHLMFNIDVYLNKNGQTVKYNNSCTWAVPVKYHHLRLRNLRSALRLLESRSKYLRGVNRARQK
jgi:hypothetical protein